MKKHKKLALISIAMSIPFFVFNIYIAIRNSRSFSVEDVLIPEIFQTVLVQINFLAPAIILLLMKNFNNKYIWSIWVYIAVLALGFLNIFLANDPLAAGLPIVVFVFPFCIIYTIILILYWVFVERRKKQTK